VPTGVHILRHTFCSHLVIRGAAMRSVQELVGHQDLTMTQRYSHLSPAALIDTIRLLEARAADTERGEMLETAEGGDRKLKLQNEIGGWEAGIRNRSHAHRACGASLKTGRPAMSEPSEATASRMAGCQGRFPQLVVDRGVKFPGSCCHGRQLHTRSELGPARMPAQGFDNGRSRVHQSERIAGLDHAFVPVGRCVEIRG
jgi:hypothetical protein